ncbi:MAG: transposase [Patescibacteria group bacterium]
MPSKFIVRNFTENSYYHIYNKGFDKKEIFLDEKDYNFFKVYLFIYTRPLKEVVEKFPDVPKRLHAKNLAKKVELLGYSLMPDHFHLLLKQQSKNSISKLMKQLINAYTLYFNQKHQRSGSLMAGRYRAVNVPFKLLTPLLRLIQNEPTNHNSLNYYLGQQTDLPCSQKTKDEILTQFPNLTKFLEYHRSQMNIARMADKVEPFIIELNGFNR